MLKGCLNCSETYRIPGDCFIFLLNSIFNVLFLLNNALLEFNLFLTHEMEVFDRWLASY